METTEQRWSLKVRCERDVAEQALSLCYTAGSVTTDCSPAPLLSSPSVSVCSITPHSHSPPLRCYSVSSYLICFSLSPLSLPATFLSVYQFLFLSISRYIAFLFPYYCRVNLFFLCLTLLCPSITNALAETLNWGQLRTIKLSNLTPPSLLPLMLLHLLCHVSMCTLIRVHVCI